MKDPKSSSEHVRASQEYTVKEHIDLSRARGSFILHEDLSEEEDYIIVYSRTRDSGGITNCNFRLIKEALDEANAVYAALSYNHFACGWYENIAVHPDHMPVVQDMIDGLEDYPIISEEEVGRCLQCEEDYDTHDSANEPFCGSFCESNYYKKPCKECGWGFDIRDVDEKKDEEGEYTCEDCV